MYDCTLPGHEVGPTTLASDWRDRSLAEMLLDELLVSARSVMCRVSVMSLAVAAAVASAFADCEQVVNVVDGAENEQRRVDGCHVERVEHGSAVVDARGGGRDQVEVDAAVCGHETSLLMLLLRGRTAPLQRLFGRRRCRCRLAALRRTQNARHCPANRLVFLATPFLLLLLLFRCLLLMRLLRRCHRRFVAFMLLLLFVVAARRRRHYSVYYVLGLVEQDEAAVRIASVGKENAQQASTPLHIGVETLRTA